MTSAAVGIHSDPEKDQQSPPGQPGSTTAPASEQSTQHDSAPMKTSRAGNTRPDHHETNDELDHTATQSTVPLGAKRQYAAMVLITLTQLAQMYPYGADIGTGLSIATSLLNKTQHSMQIIDPASLARVQVAGGWLAAAYPVCSGTFVLPGGRLGEVYGHKRLLAVGCVWWTIWQLASGFAPNLVSLCVMRGFSGMGGALMVPNSVAMLGITIPPGRRRNLVSLNSS